MWQAVSAKFVIHIVLSKAQRSLCMEVGDTANMKLSEMPAKSDGIGFGREAGQTENTYLMPLF